MKCSCTYTYAYKYKTNCRNDDGRFCVEHMIRVLSKPFSTVKYIHTCFSAACNNQISILHKVQNNGFLPKHTFYAAFRKLKRFPTFVGLTLSTVHKEAKRYAFSKNVSFSYTIIAVIDFWERHYLMMTSIRFPEWWIFLRVWHYLHQYSMQVPSKESNIVAQLLTVITSITCAYFIRRNTNNTCQR